MALFLSLYLIFIVYNAETSFSIFAHSLLNIFNEKVQGEQKIMVDDASVTLIATAAAITFFAFRAHNESVNFDLKYRSELNQVKRRLSARFRKKAEDLVVTIVTKGTNKFDKPILSVEDIHKNTDTIDLPDKVKELSSILSEIENMKHTFKKIRELKRRIETRMFIVAFIVGINAILPFLGVPIQPTNPQQPPSPSMIGFVIIGMIDVLGMLPVSDIVSAYRESSRKEEEFMKKLDEEEVEIGDLLPTSDQSDD